MDLQRCLMNMHKDSAIGPPYFAPSVIIGRADQNSVGIQDAAESRFDILLLPGFSQVSFSSFVEPLHQANINAGRRVFYWRIVGCAGERVVSSSGVQIHVDIDVANYSGICKTDGFVIIGSERLGEVRSEHVYSLLRALQRRKTALYAIGTATWLLAEAGILRRGTKCTIHWRQLAALAERFPNLVPEDCLFLNDGSVTTSAGEFAAFDLAAEIVQTVCGQGLARRVCGHLIADGFRSGAHCQSIPPGLRYAGTVEKLLRVTKHMERHIEETTSLGEIARAVSLSRRQIERLFRKHIQISPMQYYSRLRLERARQLLEMTDMPVIEVAVACGFISSSHFTKSFKDHFGVLPSHARRWGTACSPRSHAPKCD
ncbi:transcriptional regulator GlxA family with amidase domain [Mesorhizobium shonense]|uniref:Transcriptional regulator GlxA family with amidase domain n=1 Tax=Mesorhizobium shonense TaxID=1209948 RepID=A0ABV2HWR5_9HYPH